MIVGKSTYKVLASVESKFVICDLEFVLVSHHQSLHMRQKYFPASLLFWPSAFDIKENEIAEVVISYLS